MRTTIRLLLCLASLIAFAATCRAEGAVASPATVANATNDQVGDPSPNGEFAFRTFSAEDLHTIDLIDPKSGKALQRLGEEDSSQAHWHVLWALDSARFALMTRLGHPIQGIDIYVRSGASFQKVELPEIEANIPQRLKRHGSFPHFANLNWQEAKAWRKDGSLVLTVDTMIDGAGRSITATRTVVIGVDRAGKARVLTSRIRYRTETD